MRERFYTNESYLRKQYWDKKLTTSEMGALCGVKGGTIRTLMSRRGIELRSRSEAWELRAGSRPYKKKSWLRRQYWGRGRNLREMASLLGCDANTIKYWMIKYDIPRRPATGELDKGRAKREYPSLFNRFVAWLWKIIKNLDEYMKALGRQDN